MLSLLLYGYFTYIPLYWGWTEQVLACFDQRLRNCSLYQAVYASLYSYSCDAHVLCAFYKSWCPITNTLHTLHTLAKELSISLCHLHQLSGLLICSKIYDEAIPSTQVFSHQDDQNQRVIPSPYIFLFVAFRCLDKAQSWEKGVTAKIWSISGVSRIWSITHHHVPIGKTWGPWRHTSQAVRFSLVRSVGAKKSWMSLRA